MTILGGAVLAAAVIGGILILRGDRNDQTDHDEAAADRAPSVCSVEAGFADSAAATSARIPTDTAAPAGG